MLERVSFRHEAIAEALKTNSTLRSINLEGNGIGGEGGKARLASKRSVLVQDGFPARRSVKR